MGEAYERVAAALQARGHTVRNGVTRCPAHDDSTPSLSVTDADGKVLLKCHAGCATADVVDALGLKPADLFDEPKSPTGDRRPVEYDYHDADGTLIGQVLRYEPKAFRQRRPDGHGGWRWKGFTPTLYRLPDVLEAVAGGFSVFIVEGEKDADALRRMSYTATCGPMGAGKWDKVAAVAVDVLKGADVFVWADKDTAGYLHALDIVRSLDGVAGSVDVVVAASGKDAADHLAHGHTVEEFVTLTVAELERLATESDDSVEDEQEQQAPASTPLDRIRAAAITTQQLKNIPPPESLIDGVLMANTLAQIWGPPGCGKSFVTASWACHISTGTPWGDLAVKRTNVLYVVAEGAIGMGDRIDAWERHHGVTVPEDALVWLPMAIQLSNAEWTLALADYAQEVGAGLVVIDTRARCTVGVEENSSKEMGVVVDHLEILREQTSATSLLVHHGNAAGTKDRGSTVILGAVETSLAMTKEGVVKLEKQKNAPDGMSWPMTKNEVGTSIVYLPNTGRDATSAEPAGVWDALEALRDVYVGDPVSSTVWLKSSGLAERTFYKAAGWLHEKKFIDKPGRGRWVPIAKEDHPDA